MEVGRGRWEDSGGARRWTEGGGKERWEEIGGKTEVERWRWAEDGGKIGEVYYKHLTLATKREGEI